MSALSINQYISEVRNLFHNSEGLRVDFYSFLLVCKGVCCLGEHGSGADEESAARRKRNSLLEFR
ncbi:hypothetical protein V6x_14430 [Gimesia chilikensis]|uniref:Uncharacterized protein n=1 Tax=Gimesia chilikensis TaxID=2605989 RepID=A0A517W931_9PLAN|nr:hypothetical protein V6x_14430 [Gimesia chilikensis]